MYCEKKIYFVLKVIMFSEKSVENIIFKVTEVILSGCI